MTESGMGQPQSEDAGTRCARCAKDLRAGRVFAFKPPATGRPPDLRPSAQLAKCLQCALLHRPMLKRSLVAALVVGTVLTALNQGDAILSGQWNNTLYWKIPLTYCVPFIVATYGALTNSRQ